MGYDFNMFTGGSPSKKFWRKHPLLGAMFLAFWSCFAFCWDFGVLQNGGIGKVNAPNVTPQNAPILFWSFIVFWAIAGLLAARESIREFRRFLRRRVKNAQN